MCRTTILVLMTIAAEGVFVLENPANSLICLHDAWIWLVKTLQASGIQAGPGKLWAMGFDITCIAELYCIWGHVTYSCWRLIKVRNLHIYIYGNGMSLYVLFGIPILLKGVCVCGAFSIEATLVRWPKSTHVRMHAVYVSAIRIHVYIYIYYRVKDHSLWHMHDVYIYIMCYIYTLHDLIVAVSACSCSRMQVYKQMFCMKKHGSLTWKPTWTWSNSPSIKRLNHGPLTKAEKTGGPSTTRKWRKAGKKCFQGNANLKATQLPSSINYSVLYVMP